MSAFPIVIIGGTGKTGARVDARLRARGIANRTAPVTWPVATGRWSA